jgi:hypothetical protein
MYAGYLCPGTGTGSFGMNTITSFHGVTGILQLVMLQIVMWNYDKLGELDFQPK